MPDWKITVYVVSQIDPLRRLAGMIHGIEIPYDAIGYSYQDDLSIVVLCRERYTGTMWHELFHVMARTTFGDIPPWLDEGVAALYEVSELHGDSAAGLKNWRGRVLKQLWHDRPDLRRLVAMDWREFDRLRGESDARAQAANHATSRYFALYLQQKGLLQRVFNAIRQQTPATTTLPPGEAAIKSIEEICGKSIRELDDEFASWFQQVER